MRPSVRKTTTLLRTIAMSLRYAIDDGGVQARRSRRSADPRKPVNLAHFASSAHLLVLTVAIRESLDDAGCTDGMGCFLQKRRFLAPNDPHVGADWIRRFDVVVAYADALATSAIAEKVIPFLLAPICCASDQRVPPLAWISGRERSLLDVVLRRARPLRRTR
jgi:hypothetical protein